MGSAWQSALYGMNSKMVVVTLKAYQNSILGIFLVLLGICVISWRRGNSDVGLAFSSVYNNLLTSLDFLALFLSLGSLTFSIFPQPPLVRGLCWVQHLSAPKSRDSLQLRRQLLTLHAKLARFEGPRCVIPCHRKSPANGDFLCD